MSDRAPKILLVEPDPDMVEMLVGSLRRRFDAQVTCVDGADACLNTDLYDPHDLVIAEWELEDSDGLQLAESLTILAPRPIILLADEPTSRDAIGAMRLGVRDLFTKPFPVEDLLDATERAVTGHELKRQHAVKYRRMRELVRHVIRERRDLNRRIELVCRDLVEAHRRLVHRVLALEGTQAGQTT